MSTRYGSRASGHIIPYNPLAVAWAWAWWASDPSWTPPADGGQVTTWRNAGSLGGGIPTQSTSSRKALYRAAATDLNGQPAIEFDGADDYYETTAATTQIPPIHIFIVGYLASDAASGAPTPLDSASANRLMVRPRSGGTVEMFGGTGRTFGTALPLGSKFTMFALFNGASSSCRLNGTSYDSATVGNVGTNFYDLPRIGTNSATSAWFKGLIAFIGIKAAALTPAEIGELSSWAAVTYGAPS